MPVSVTCLPLSRPCLMLRYYISVSLQQNLTISFASDRLCCCCFCSISTGTSSFSLYLKARHQALSLWAATAKPSTPSQHSYYTTMVFTKRGVTAGATNSQLRCYRCNSRWDHSALLHAYFANFTCCTLLAAAAHLPHLPASYAF